MCYSDVCWHMDENAMKAICTQQMENTNNLYSIPKVPLNSQGLIFFQKCL